MTGPRKHTLGSIVRRAWQVAGDPDVFMQTLLKRSHRASFARKLEFDAFKKPYYAYGVYHAALQAKALGIREISALEFGVFRGKGLMQLEAIADGVKAETGVHVRVFGFGMAVGMPKPLDERDLPYVWTTGLFRMPVKQIREQLRHAELVLGDVADTVPTFIHKFNPPPVGFVSIDVDYYSSTVSVLKLFDSASQHLLPRVFCYLDDCIGGDHELHCRFAGELLAVDEFNDAHPRRKLAPIFGLRHKRRIPAPWNDVMYVLHSFDHPHYGTYMNPKWQAPAATPEASPVVVRAGSHPVGAST